MKKIIFILASLLAVNVSACELGDVCVGAPDISTNVPSGYGKIYLECHVWSYYSGETVKMAAVPGDNLKFDIIQLNDVSWAGKDLIITAKYVDPSHSGAFTFANMSSGVITSQCHMLPDSIKA
jgi:hypothetical protein